MPSIFAARSRAFALALTLFAAAPLAVDASTMVDPFLSSVRRTVLPNGLTVISREQPGSGVVAVDSWVKAGYFHEPDEVAGMAHLFEHMFFKGSEKFPGAEQIMLEVAGIGGRSNAGTIYDSTNYYFVVPREGFRRALEIQADAIMHPRFDPAELRKEAEVVIEESNRKLDNAPAVAIERMYATAFTAHRMKRWRIGSNEVLRNIERDDLLAFFETLYRPANIVLAVAGDVRHEEVLAAARETFGAIPAGTPKKERGPAEPPQTAMRFARSEGDIRTAYSVYGWHSAAPTHADTPALDVLAAILADGRASRLYRAAVAPEAASDVEASNDAFDDIGVLTVLAAIEEPNRAETDRRVLTEVERLRQHGPTAWEVRRAVNRMTSGLLFDLEDVLGQAVTLAQFEAWGGYADLATRVAALEKLTPADVQRVARQYLTLDHLTLYHYQPKGAPALDRDTALAAARAATAGSFTAEPERALPAAAAALPGARADQPLHQATLGNGVRVVVRENPGAPVVSAGIYFPGGRLDETSGNAGITRLAANSARRGTATRSGDEIDRTIEFLGTQLGVNVSDDYFGLTLQILTPGFIPGLELLADVVRHPTFPAAEIDEERHLQLAAIRTSQDSGFERPFQLLLQALWGSHPYAQPGQGYAAAVEALERDAVAGWWRQHVRADGALIVVAGDVAAPAVMEQLEAAFGSLEPGAAPRRAVAPPRPPAAAIEIVETRDRRQTAMAVAFPAVSPRHADWAALRLLQNLTSGLTGTFGIELRGRRSLAYTVFTQALGRAEGGALLGYLASDAAKEPEARAGLLGEFARLVGDGVQPEAVERSKKLLVGSSRIGLQTSGAQVDDLARNHFLAGDLGLTEKVLAAVPKLKVEDLRAVAQRVVATPAFAAGTLRGQAPAKAPAAEATAAQTAQPAPAASGATAAPRQP